MNHQTTLQMQHRTTDWITAGLCTLVWAASGGMALAQPTQCQYDPNSGVPNPLGMRAYLTITEQDGNTQFVFEQFPSNLGIDSNIPATIASSRTLTFYDTGIDAARQILLDHPAYYSELMGYEDSEGFAAVNRVLTCR